MNESILSFAVLRVVPDHSRGESMNVGLVVFDDENPRVLFRAPISRLRALHPDLDSIDPVAWAAELEGILKKYSNIKDQHDAAQYFGGVVTCDTLLGNITIDEDDHSDEVVSSLLRRFVDVPDRMIAVTNRSKIARSQLNTQLRQWFRHAKLFSRRQSDLSKQKIVSDYPIVAEDDLFADFALKNGAIHIIEAIDLRGISRPTRASQGHVSVAAIMLDQARLKLPPTSRRIAITAADDYSLLRGSMNILSHYTNDVLTFESAEDRKTLSDFIAASLHVSVDLPPIVANMAS